MACLVKGLTVVSACHARRNEAVCLGNEDNAPACQKKPLCERYKEAGTLGHIAFMVVSWGGSSDFYHDANSENRS